MNSNNRLIRARIIADIALFFIVLYAPWWLVGIAVIAGVSYFKNFYEAFFAGFLFDTLYGASIAGLHGFRFVFSSAFLLFIFAADFIKTKVRI